jgi:hypothetical protein
MHSRFFGTKFKSGLVCIFSVKVHTLQTYIHYSIRNCWIEMLARSLDHIINTGPFSIRMLSIILFNTVSWPRESF